MDEMTDGVSDPRWGYDDRGRRERGWSVEERDTFVRSVRADLGANWSHHDGRMQSVWLSDRRAHVTFGDRPEDKARVWVDVFDANANRIDGPRWVNGGPEQWRRALFGFVD